MAGCMAFQLSQGQVTSLVFIFIFIATLELLIYIILCGIGTLSTELIICTAFFWVVHFVFIWVSARAANFTVSGANFGWLVCSCDELEICLSLYKLITMV